MSRAMLVVFALIVASAFLTASVSKAIYSDNTVPVEPGELIDLEPAVRG